MAVARALTGAVMLGATAYFREVMTRESPVLLQAVVMVGMIVGLVLYTQLCIAEGERRATKPNGSTGDGEGRRRARSGDR